MTVSASPRQKTIGALMLLAALVYLVHFVARGWIAQDEGMLGQSAERVMLGGIPHVDYQEPYTGGLSWLYAGVFRLSGVDLLHLRWALFAGALLAMWLMYCILRRHLSPTGAALATWVGLAWSFPNWFTALPSWWLLVCALWCILCVIRHVETGHWRYIAAAGLSTGISITLKQTGVYLFLALVMFLLYEHKAVQRKASPVLQSDRFVRAGFATVATIFAAVTLAPRMFAAEGVYLFLPIAACSILLLMPVRFESLTGSRSLKVVGIATIAAALPVALLVIPYVAQHRLWDFVYGAFVLPRTRLTFASIPMPPAAFIITGIPLLGLALPLPRSMFGARSRVFEALMWIAAVALPVLALWSFGAYQWIWQSTRAFAALLPLAICWGLAAGQVRDDSQKRVLFIMASMLAWASLNQYPWGVPAYFCYVAPLAVIGAVATSSARSSLRPHAMVPWALMLILFSILGPNRGYMGTLGFRHVPRHFDADLDMPRAHLKIATEEAELYRDLVSATERHLGGGQLIAGPDCPEIYFLLGLFNPSGALFDFLSDNSERLFHDNAASRSGANVVVVNRIPQFSPALTPDVLAQLRSEFPHGEEFGKFEVRWR